MVAVVDLLESKSFLASRLAQFGKERGAGFYAIANDLWLNERIIFGNVNFQSKLTSEITVTQKYQARIYVTLRPSVLDPAGTAVQSGLQHMGYDNVERVRIGKYIELTLSCADEGAARLELDRICDQLLANPVIENYSFDLTELAVNR